MFSLEYKQLITRNAQTYENLTENLELQALEAQLQEAKKHCRYSTRTTEGLDPSRKNEEISRTTHCPTTGTHTAK
jgi:hypothetical protein